MPPRRYPSMGPDGRVRLDGYRVSTTNLERATNSLRDVHNRLRDRIMQYQHEEDETRELVARARALNERLAAIRHKIQAAFHGALLDDDEAGVVGRPALSSSRPTGVNILNTLRYDYDDEGNEAPREFVCPITQMVMIDPVCTCDGHTYERAAIMEWFSHFEGRGGTAPTSPLTNLPLDTLDLKTNSELRVRIEEYLRAKGGERPPALVGPDMAAPLEVSLRTTTTSSSRLPRAPTTVTRRGSSTRHGLGAPSPGDVAREVLREIAREESMREMGLWRPGVGAGSLSATTTTATTTTSDTTPIWRSSVVPTQETNSRELNALRINQDIPVPTTTTTTVGHPPRRASSMSGVSRQQPQQSRNVPTNLNRHHRATTNTAATGLRRRPAPSGARSSGL
eukprot:PhM_4_TR650/c0_g1_i1/m.74528